MNSASEHAALPLSGMSAWKSNRGEYALDDLGMVDWYEHAKANAAWPPM
ncbi:hypothetical protein [Stenotrophomonas sp. VV52]|nr:hypothetical protein [Stenotrophomonas sp. VV52]